MKIFKKLISYIVIFDIIFNSAFFSFVNADNSSFSNTSLTLPSLSYSYKPNDDITFKIQAVNLTSASAVNPSFYFNPGNDLTYYPGTGTGYFSASRGALVEKAYIGYTPAASYTGVFSGLSLPANQAFSVNGLKYKIDQNYSSTTINPSLSFSAVGFTNTVHSNSSNTDIHVDVVPHIQEITLSKNSIYNNSSDSLNITAKIIDYNGCENLKTGVAYVRVNLDSIGLGTVDLNDNITCDPDGVTGHFTKNGISASSSVTSGIYNFTVTARDADNHLNGSDSFFSSEDKNSAFSLNVNSTSAPTITFLSPVPDSVFSTNNKNINISWHSSETGSYVIYAGANPTCSSGLLVGNGTANQLEVINSVLDSSNPTLEEGNNNIIVCVTNEIPVLGTQTIRFLKDTIAPISSKIAFDDTVGALDSNVAFTSNENGTYKIFVNGTDSGISGSILVNEILTTTIPNALLTVNPGNNAFYIRVTDAAGNSSDSSVFNIYKDLTPPPPVTNVNLEDCDYIGNTSTKCADGINPKTGVSGRDFHVSWDSPTSFSGFLTYKIYILPESTALDTSVHIPSYSVSEFSQTGIVLSDTLKRDSVGNDFVQGGVVNYKAHIIVTKGNDLSSTVAVSPSAAITSDTVNLPVFQSAKFLSGTILELTYSKTLDASLLKFNSEKVSASGGCFYMDYTDGSGAVNISGNSVRFKTLPFSDLSKTCNTLNIGTGAITDLELLYNEEIMTGATITDGQAPNPLSITSPIDNVSVGGDGNFSLGYNLPELMSSGLEVVFKNETTGLTKTKLLTNLNAGPGVQAISGSGFLDDGFKYSIFLSGSDIAGNSGTGNTVTGFLFDITPPTLPVLNGLYLNSEQTNNITPILTWVGSTDNFSATANLKYDIELSNTFDFTGIVQSATNLTSTGFTFSSLLNDSSYFWRVRAIDETNNASDWGLSGLFIFDSTPPVISEHYNETYITNTTLSLTGVVKSGQNVILTSKITDFNIAQMNVSNISANFSNIGGLANVQPSTFDVSTGVATWIGLTANCFSDGNKDIGVSATDKAGNIATKYNAILECDSTVGTGAIIYPTASTTLSGGITTNIVWDETLYASETNKIGNPITIDYSLDNGSTWTNIVSNYSNIGNVAWSVPSSTDTTLGVIRIITKDLLNNVSTGSSANFIIDSTPPAIAANAFTAPTAGSFNIGSIGTGINIAWNPGNITDSIALDNNPISLEFSVDSGSTWSSIVSDIPNNGSYIWETQTIDSDKVKLKIIAKDKAGHVTNQTSSNFVVDSTNPSLTINTGTPDDNSFINNSGFYVNLSASDTNIDKVFYSLKDSDGNYWSELLSGPTTTPFNWNPICTDAASCSNVSHLTNLSGFVVDGKTYTLIMRAQDKAGNYIDSPVRTYEGDILAPVFSNLSATTASGTYISKAGAIFSGKAIDARSGVSSVLVNITKQSNSYHWDGSAWVNTGSVINLLTTGPASSWSYDFSSIALASDNNSEVYNVSIVALDSAYSVNTKATYTFNLILDKNPPSINNSSLWINPTSTVEIIKGESSYDIKWNPANINDIQSGLANNGIKLEYFDGIQFQTIIDSTANSGSYLWSVPKLDVDSTIRLTATDKVGNTEGVVSPTLIIDSIPPTITKIETVGDTTGKIGGLLVYFSEVINIASGSLANFTVGGATLSNSYTTSVIGSATVLKLNFTTPIGTTATAPVVDYVSSANNITDRAGHNLASVSGINSIDMVGPVVTSADIYDIDKNGKLDQIQVGFSENISNSLILNGFILNGGFPQMDIKSITMSGSEFVINLNESANINTSPLGLSLTLNNTLYMDSHNNLVSNFFSIPLSDKASPILVSAITSGTNGNVDNVNLTFSESLTGTLTGFNLNSFPVLAFTGNITHTANQLSLNLNPALLNTDQTGSLDYTGDLHDTVGNQVSSLTNVSISDGVAPKIISSETADTDGNGRIDQIITLTSEKLAPNTGMILVDSGSYNVTNESTSGSNIYTTVTEKQIEDSGVTPTISINQNNFFDLASNAIAANTSSSIDKVGPVINGARYIGNIIYLNFSENVPSANIGDFVLRGPNLPTITGVTVSGNQATLNLNTNIVSPNEISFVPNTVSDSSGNKQPGFHYELIGNSIIINEVLYGSGNNQYIELKNLGSDTVFLDNWTIGNAGVTLPTGATIAGNSYYLIEKTGISVLSGTTADFSTNMNITGDITLNDSTGNVFDKAVASAMQTNGNAGIAMERRNNPGDGNILGNWNRSVVNDGLLVGNFGTPGRANVFDVVSPVISGSSLADNDILPTGDFSIVFDYTDDIGVDVNSSTFGITSALIGDITNAGNIVSSGVTSTKATYNFTNVPYGKYTANFQIRDTTGNPTSRIVTFFVDQATMIISSGSLDMGALQSDGNIHLTTNTTITIKTVGAAFDLKLGGDQIMNGPAGGIGSYSGVTGYGFDYAESGDGNIKNYTTTLTPITDGSIGTYAKNPTPDGTMRTYVFDVKYGARIATLQAAGSYTTNSKYTINLGY